LSNRTGGIQALDCLQGKVHGGTTIFEWPEFYRISVDFVPGRWGRRRAEGDCRSSAKGWASNNAESNGAPAKTAKPKRKLSAAGKAAIVAALKKRWAAKKAAAAESVKKTAPKK
jgi:hypothetical protein